MPNYRYSLTLKYPLPAKNIHGRHIVHVHDDDDDVLSAILYDLLEELRRDRLDRLMKNYNGDVEDAEALRKYLPSEYRILADNLDLLEMSMASLYEVVNMYEISNIEQAPQCYGCLYDRMGQKDHMECDTGCLHDKETCFLCSPS